MKKLSIFLLAVLCTTAVIGCGSAAAFAAEGTVYSNVLDDLRTDPNFDINDYPFDYENYDLSVIQVAETKARELLVYVYQPSCKLQAEEIRMSTTLDDELAYRDYDLELLNSKGVFFKYRVKDFMVRREDVRYYAITQITRKIDIYHDPEDLVHQGSLNRPFAVEQLWTVESVGDNVTYSMTTVKTVEILNPFVSFQRYKHRPGVFRYYYTDSHYIAFNTDERMDELLEADVSFYTINYREREIWTPWSQGMEIHFEDEVKHAPVTLYADNEHSNHPGLFVKEKTWNEIETAAHFLANENLNTTARNAIEKCSWIIRFWETEAKYVDTGPASSEGIYYEGVMCTKVTILRLKFKTDGVTYNLGAVSNKVHGTLFPSGGSPGLSNDGISGDEGEAIKEALESSGVSDFFGKAGNGIKNFFSKIGGGIKSLFQKAGNGIKDIFQKIFDGLKNNIPWYVWLIIAVVVFSVLCIAIRPLGRAVWFVISWPFKAIAKAIRRRKEEKAFVASKTTKTKQKKAKKATN